MAKRSVTLRRLGLASGQSSTLTGTLAGQVVMEGFVRLRLRPWVRRLVTRSVAIAPALLVLAFWFVTQFFSGMAAITHASRATSGDVAVWAHVAGFVFGAASAFVLPKSSAKMAAGAAGSVVQQPITIRGAAVTLE